jgi:HAD superfamily hydrolase (TIGR01509 family)
MAAAVLWDLDGVIVHSGPYHYEAYRRLFAELGVPLAEDRFRGELLGLRNDAILRAVLGELPLGEAARLAVRKEETFRELVRGEVEALPGALDLMRRAHGAGLRQAVVSSTPRENIEMILGALGVRELLDEIVGEEDATRGKPDPEGFVVAASRLGVPAGGCVVIEDAPEGIAAGKAAGARVIGVATTRPPERLAEADLVVRSLEDARVWGFVAGEA